MINKLVEISFALLFMLTGLASKAQTVEAVSRLQPDSVLIGQQALLEISLKIPADFEVDWPDWGDTLITGIEILNTGALQREPIDKDGNIRMYQELRIASFDQGLYYIPGAELNFSPPSDSAFFTAQTNPLMLQVSTVAIDTTAGFKPIKGPVAAPIGFWEVFPWIIGLLALALLALLLYLYFRRRGGKEIPVPIISKPIVPAHIVALNKLEEIRLMKLWQAGKYKTYHSLLSETIREYIEARFEVNAVEMTTDEILAAVDLMGINRDALAKLARALQLGDLVKFAKAEPAALENDMCYSHLVDFVNESHGIQEAQGQPQEEKEDEVGNQKDIDIK
jgi:hypothetical protein